MAICFWDSHGVSRSKKLQKGEYVQITLGIRPKTLKQAAGVGDKIKFGVEDPNSPNTIKSNSSGGLVPTDGFYYVDEDF